MNIRPRLQATPLRNLTAVLALAALLAAVSIPVRPISGVPGKSPGQAGQLR